MSPEDIWESEEIFSSNDSLELELLSDADRILLIQEIVRNENMQDGTILCYQVFSNIISNSIQYKSFEEDYSQLNVISKCIKRLNKVNKFETLTFTDLLLKRFRNIPLEVVWWLQKNDIMYLSEYCDILLPANLASDLLKIVTINSQNKTFPAHMIVQDLLTELVRGCYRPNLSICRLYRSYTWSEYCLQTVDNLIEAILKIVLKENDKPFPNFFPFLHNSRKYIPRIILERFYESVLKKILLYDDGNEFDLFSSYIYQQLWGPEKINNNLFILYEELFVKYCNMQSILEIIKEYEEKLNWKLTLAAVGVCVKKSSTGYVDAKNAALTFLNDSFKGGKVKPFVKSMLVIRQACLEKDMTDYRSWYSSTFGLKSDFKTTNNSTLFKFFITTLMKLTLYEPKSYLKIQIQQGISAPPKCNYLIHDYKKLCRARLEELKQSPSCLINGVEISVLHMVEESSRIERISPIMINIILTQRDSFYNIIVPQILRNKMPYIKVKELLLQEKYLTNELIHFSHPDPDGKIFDDDDEDFIFKHL